jgi:glyoxylase-like metal-dependent hydrolase (beta-lactamase superfamily II)
MAQKSELSVNFYASGYCKAHTFIVNRQIGFGKTSFYAVWALINIPNVGYTLFDTGYSLYFQSATCDFPQRLYRWATPVYVEPEKTAKAILEKQGIKSEEIKYIIISHFHADHIAGMKDFPAAKFLCSKSAYDEVKTVHGISAVSKGILHKLLPDDFDLRVSMIEDVADRVFVNDYGMTTFELFGMSTALTFILLQGHAKGMLGFIFQNDNDTVLYGTDASWSYDTYSQDILPLKIVKLFFDSWEDFIASQRKIKVFELKARNGTVLFTHCKKTLSYIANEI